MVYRKNTLDLEYVIVGMKFDVEFQEDVFSKEEQQDLRDFIEKMSKEIYIDKTYVECKENLRKSTFMIESGWNALQDLILDSKYCRYLDTNGIFVVIDAFMTMCKCYMYECLAVKTDNFQDIAITVKKDCIFDVVVCKDVAHDSKRYIGQWQDWKFDENGNFMHSSSK